MFHLRKACTLLLLALTCLSSSAQRVGVVLSGGGASAMAHVGFLRALEENDVPIDYIAGTSMGAIVGAMYASGMTVDQIDSLARSEEFQMMANGELDDSFRYFFKAHEQDASWISVKYAKGEFISSTLPTNLIDPKLMEFRFMQAFSPATAACRANFDSLFVPFRCIAADIEAKEEIVFRKGDLAEAIRASATYPFYLPARRVDGRLLFDGGLYNNFPSNVIYEDFLPDVIIGCNVSENSEPPDEDDLISQLKNMILRKTNFEALCDQMFIIEPELDIETFDFDQVSRAISAGYRETMAKMPEMLPVLERRVTAEERRLKREAFLSKCPPLVFDEITINGLEKTQKGYVRSVLGRNADTITVEQLRPSYFRVLNDDKIKSVYPKAIYKPATGYFGLNLDVRKEKDIMVSFGGNFSSRPLNTGFIGLRYNLFSRFTSTLTANSYFGKFYGSILVAARFDFAAGEPFSVEPHYAQNRWDYFKSQTTFFEDVKPSFIVKNERYAGFNFRFPVRSKGRIEARLRYIHLFDDYYQNTNFLSTDTADQTVFDGGTLRMTYLRSTLNRKQYASEGTYLRISGQFVRGLEKTIPGSTQLSRDTLRQNLEWLSARLTYQNFFSEVGPVKMGILLDGNLTSQPFFQNYIASVIRSPGFEPLPESQTLFMPQFRAHAFGAGGLMLVWRIRRNLDLRAEGYVFQPFQQIVQTNEGLPEYANEFDRSYMGSSSLVLHLPFGPLSFSVNYYDRKPEPWSVLVNFGYLLFNDRAID